MYMYANVVNKGNFRVLKPFKKATRSKSFDLNYIKKIIFTHGCMFEANNMSYKGTEINKRKTRLDLLIII